LGLKLLVLSPHRDDAAFSLSLAIGHWLSVKHRVTILNVFTRSLYAPYSDAESVHENDRLQWVSAMRKREDGEFLKRVPGAEMVDLNVKDAPIRLRCDAATVCEMAVDANDSATPKIQKAIKKALAEGFEGLVIPLALGHHVDHRVVRDAALEFTTGLPCAFYEDLPYATRDGVRVDLARFREDTEARFQEELHPVLCHGTHTQPSEVKRRIALLYASQIDGEMADTIAGFSHRYKGAERLWANQQWLDAAGEKKLSTRQRDEAALPLPE
jgi:LmbE family N-acetylglucosaminyl deacetylase